MITLNDSRNENSEIFSKRLSQKKFSNMTIFQNPFSIFFCTRSNQKVCWNIDEVSVSSRKFFLLILMKTMDVLNIFWVYENMFRSWILLCTHGNVYVLSFIIKNIESTRSRSENYFDFQHKNTLLDCQKLLNLFTNSSQHHQQ